MKREAFINNSWRRLANLPELKEIQPISLKEMLSTEWSSRFETLLRNRLVVGVFDMDFLMNQTNLDMIGSLQ